MTNAQRVAQREAVRRYREKNRDKLNAAERERRATDPLYAERKRAATRTSVTNWKQRHPKRAMEIAKKHYAAHADKYRQQAIDYYWEHQEARKVYSKARYHSNPAAAKRKVQEWQRALKAAVFAHYGGACQCCGESHLAFLTLDHSRDDGASHRKSIESTTKTKWSGNRFYRWLQQAGFPQNIGLRVLCFNCNCGRHVNGGVCPHNINH